MLEFAVMKMFIPITYFDTLNTIRCLFPDVRFAEPPPLIHVRRAGYAAAAAAAAAVAAAAAAATPRLRLPAVKFFQDLSHVFIWSCVHLDPPRFIGCGEKTVQFATNRVS